MDSVEPTQFQRVMFERSPAALSRLLELIAHHPTTQLPEGIVSRLLGPLTSSDRNIIRIDDDCGFIALGVIIDQIETVDGLPIFELLAMTAEATHDVNADAVISLLHVVEHEARHQLKAPGVDLPINSRWAHHLEHVRRRGFKPAFVSYDMETPDGSPPPCPPLPSDEWRWIEGTAEHAEAYHAVVRAAMLAIPGAAVGDADSLRDCLVPGSGRYLLMHKQAIAGFVTIEYDANLKAGVVSLLGRDPQYRGLGLGAQLLSFCMQSLAALGATHFKLSVSATNEAALDLYQRHGFQIIETSPTYRKRWCDAP